MSLIWVNGRHEGFISLTMLTITFRHCVTALLNRAMSFIGTIFYPTDRLQVARARHDFNCSHALAGLCPRR